MDYPSLVLYQSPSQYSLASRMDYPSLVLYQSPSQYSLESRSNTGVPGDFGGGGKAHHKTEGTFQSRRAWPLAVQFGGRWSIS